MDINMNTSAEFNEKVSATAKSFLINGHKIKIKKNNDGSRLCIEGYEDLDFTIEEIKDIDTDEKLRAFIDSKTKKEEVPVSPTMETVDLIDKTQVDMLYTKSMDPIKPDVTVDSAPVNIEIVPNPSSENLIIEKNPEKMAVPQVDEAPNMMPTAKTYTLSPQDSSSGGFADVLIISIIVLVYVAIIVNLIIRIK